MLFAVCILVGIYVGRKAGWGLSKAILYPGPIELTVVASVVWGTGVALLLRLGFNALHPGLVLKILGYGAGGYVATPNYGLVLESTLPIEIQGRHQLITSLPFVTFIIGCVIFAIVWR